MPQKVRLTHFTTSAHYVQCTCRRKVNRWPVVLLGSCIDVGAVTTCVIWMTNYSECKSSEGKQRKRVFLLERDHKLVLFNIKRRAAASTFQVSI